MWHFCGSENNNKLESIKKRALRLILNDYECSYTDLLETYGTTTVLVARLKRILIDVFKCINGTNAKCLNELFSIKDVAYSLRNPLKLVQPKCATTKFGLKSIQYIGSKLWNDLPAEFHGCGENDLHTFKSLLDNWSGPHDIDQMNIYV